MQINKSLIIAAIAVLVVVSTLAVVREGLPAMATPFRASFWTWQYFVDLVIALGIVMIWIWHDCKRRGKSALMWIGATFITGSFAPLLYLLLRHNDKPN